ncbi:MAG: hypothetical protein V3U65_06275 [Granulosicoccaceae bacterium]
MNIHTMSPVLRKLSSEKTVKYMFTAIFNQQLLHIQKNDIVYQKIRTQFMAMSDDEENRIQ